MIDFFTEIIGMAFALICSFAVVCLFWIPVALVLIVIYVKLTHKTIDINNISEAKLLLLTSVVPYFLGVGLLYWIQYRENGGFWRIVLVGGAIGIFRALIGFFAYFFSYGIGYAILSVIEKFVSSYVDLKKSIKESYANGPIPIVIGIVTTLYFLKSDIVA